MKAFHEQREYHSGLPFSAWTPKDITFLAHWHHDLEFIYICEGEVRVGINSEMRLLRRGDLALCGSGDIHYYDSTDLTSKALIITFHPQLIGYPGGWPQGIRFKSPFVGRAEVESGYIDAVQVKSLIGMMNRLLAEWTEQQQHYELFVSGILHELCGTLLRSIPYEIADSKRDKRRMINTKMMQEILDYIEENYMNPVSLEDAANHCNMSKFHFARFFKSTAGLSFISYVNSLRVQQAEQLITTTNKPIIDIAAECGFSSIRTFNRTFKQIKNCRPSDLR